MASRLRPQRAEAEAKLLLVTYASPGGAAFRREFLQTLYVRMYGVCAYLPM